MYLYNVMKKICIVHYNTPTLTECLIKSINKYVGTNCHIYIFDNSDKKPFTYRQHNITIFDNTKGQIINFNEWLKNFPKKGGEATGNFSSAKHSISIDKCMDLINDNFILMDSDILLRKDISALIDEDSIYVGEFQPCEALKQKDVGRLLPFICFINVKMCKKNNIRYFNENFMHGLNKFSIGHYYDTGGAFWYYARNYKHKDIKIGDYITHYKGGSWDINYPSNKKEHGNLTPEEWLEINNRYFNNNNKVIYTCITGNYEKLIEPSVISNNFDYICFSDDPNLTSNVWDIKPIPEDLQYLSKVKQQRCIKICPHKYLSEYDTSIWVDGSIDIIGDVNVFLQKECNEDDKIIYIPEHPNRNCIYQEGITCINMKKDIINNIDTQIDKYKKENYPQKNGLVQSNIVIRKHNNKSCIEVMELWKEELIKHSHRDQLSFNYALWKTNNIDILKYLDKKLYDSKYFKWYSRHNRGINNKIKQNYLLDEYNITNIKTKKEHKKTLETIVNTRQQVKRLKKKSDDMIINAIYENF